MIRVLTFVAAAAFAMSAATADAAAGKQCRDAKGKFVACPASAAPKPQCKDAKGKFVKCSAPGATPVKK
jgi:hypothetical protein